MQSTVSLPIVSSNTVFEPVPHWAKVPHGIWLREATSVAVDRDDNVFVFNRGNKPMLVFDPDGNVIDMWGNEFKYVFPGKTHENKYDLWSIGPDKEDGTEDDILSWNVQ